MTAPGDESSETPLLALPRDPASAPFFDAAAEGRLLVRRSAATGEYLPPAAQVDSAGGTELEWVEAAGTGRIASWAAVHRKPDAQGRTFPVVVAIVELDEGPWLHARIVRAAPGDVASGAPVTVEFVRPEGGETLPVFALVPGPTGGDDHG